MNILFWVFPRVIIKPDDLHWVSGSKDLSEIIHALPPCIVVLLLLLLYHRPRISSLIPSITTDVYCRDGANAPERSIGLRSKGLDFYFPFVILSWLLQRLGILIPE